MVPIVVITGFLGAGKTTFLQRILSTHSEKKLGVIVNDFASLNIDAELVKAQTNGIISLQNGCVCCTMRDDLARSVDELLLSEQGAELSCILIEGSGLSHGDGVVKSLDVSNLKGRVQVSGTVCLVDVAGFGHLDFQETEFAIDQAAASDLVLLNKVDRATPDEIVEVRAVLNRAIAHVCIIETVGAALATDQISSLLAGEFALLAHENGPRHTAAVTAGAIADAYDSFSWSSERPLSVEAVRTKLQQLPKGMVRAKGIFYPHDLKDVCMVYSQTKGSSALVYMDRLDPTSSSGTHSFVAVFRGDLDCKVDLGRLLPPIYFDLREPQREAHSA